MKKASLALCLCLASSVFAQNRHLDLGLSPELRAQSRFCGSQPPAEQLDIMNEHRFENSMINEKLSTGGLRVWMHGVVPLYKHFVATYRAEDPTDPMAFFKAQQFSLIPGNAEIAAQLASLKRHDEVRLKGRIFLNGSPLVHIRVSGLEVIKKFDTPTQHTYSVDPRVFENYDTADVFAMVHALTHSDELGWAIVLEYQSMLMPVALRPEHTAIAAKLYRGDIVQLRVDVVHHPRGTVHFEASAGDSIEIVDSLLHCHNQARELVGTLVKFDKSPAITTDVYAVRIVDENGMARNFTFFPADGLSEDDFLTVFRAVSAKAKAAWEASSQVPRDLRNFREKSSVRVKANGVMNMVSTEQANAQIYIKSADQVEFVVTTQE